MRPQPKKAREFLLRALAALRDPEAYCKENGYEFKNNDQARCMGVGCAISTIEFALHSLGEPIDPWRPIDAGPYVPPKRTSATGGRP